MLAQNTNKFIFSGKWIVIVVYFILWINHNSWAQLPENTTPRYINFTDKDGLPSNEIHAILEDKEGYLWIATDHGAVRYDGYEFKTFTTEDGLPSITVLNMYKDEKDRIWFITLKDGVSYYEKGKIQLYQYNKKLLEHSKKNKDYAIFHIDDKNNVYYTNIGNHQIIKIDSTGDMSYFEENLLKKDAYWLDQKTSESQLLSGNKNWVKIPVKKDTLAEGVYVFGKSSIPFLRLAMLYKEDSKNFKYRRTFKINKDSLTFLTKARDQVLIKTILQENKQILIETYLFNKKIHISFIDKKNRLLLATDSDVEVYNDGILKKTPDETLLSGKSVISAYEDIEGGYWFASLYNGIYYAPSSKNAIYDFLFNPILSDPNVSAIQKDASNALIIGYNNTGTIDKIHKRVLEKVLLKKHSIQKEYTLKSENKNGQVFLSNSVNGLYLFKGNKFQAISNSKTNKVYHIEKLSQHTFFQAGRNGSFYQIFDGEKVSPLQNPGILRLNKIISNQPNVVWLASTNGLWSYHHKESRFQNHGNHNSLLRNRIDVMEADKNNLFLGTKEAGLIIKTNNRSLQITTKEGLISNSISSLALDHHTIWVGSLKGLSKVVIKSYNPFSYTIINYTTFNNLISNYINTLHVTDSLVYVGTNKGVSVIDKFKLKKDTVPPRMRFSKIDISGKNYRYAIPSTLDHSQNNVQIGYTALSFSSRGNVQYKYRMLPDDDTWTYTDVREVQYRNLAPNSYRFEVYGQSYSGVWSTQPAVFEFTISPPFWQIWWFVLIEITVVLGGIYFLFIWRFRVAQKKENEKRILHHKMNELKAMSLQTKMNPHFIFNSLNSIQNHILENQKKEANDYLLDFSKLIRTILKNSNSYLLPLQKELEAIRLYVSLEKRRLQADFDYIEKIDPKIDLKKCNIPSLLIQPFIENAIWHGKIHALENGKIALSIHRETDLLVIEIIDNGVGRKAKITRQKGKTTHATSITEGRIKLLSELHEGLSDIRITDAYPTKKHKGTKVYMTIPYKK